MSTLKSYEKPMLMSVAVQSNRSVADVCWGEGASGNSPTHYYDSSGHGFVKFRVTTPDCKEWDGQLNEYSYTCLYVENGTYPNNQACPQWSQELEAAALAEFDVAFNKYYATVSNHGSSASGFSDTFPHDPHDKSA